MILTLDQIKINLGHKQLFENLSIEINAGEHIAFIGPNGTGKTTLLKLIAGLEKPESGGIYIRKGTRIAYLTQVQEAFQGTVKDYLTSCQEKLLAMKKELSTLETQMGNPEADLEKVMAKYGKVQETFIQEGGYELEAKVSSVAEGIGIGELMDRPLDTLSGGQKTKAALACCLLKEPDLLLLDEPTNHLDLNAVVWLENWLNHFSGTVIITSHDRTFINQTVKKIYDLDNEEEAPYFGNYDDYVKEKENRLLIQFAKYEEQQKKIQKMKETIKRLKLWANQASPPNAGLHRRAKSMEKALVRMEKLKKPKSGGVDFDLGFEASERSGERVVHIENLTLGFEQAGTLFDHVGLDLRYGDRLGLVGENGSGKTTLMKLIRGGHNDFEGKVALGSRVKIGYLSQTELFPESGRSVLEAFRDGVSISIADARHRLAKFMFYSNEVFKPLRELSGGEKVRLRLAQLMLEDVNLLLLDEPTNHLDIPSREVLEEALLNFRGTILAISHDRYFLNQCFTKTAILAGKKVTVLPYSYDAALAKYKTMNENPHNRENK